jgi:hypothetical protein
LIIFRKNLDKQSFKKIVKDYTAPQEKRATNKTRLFFESKIIGENHWGQTYTYDKMWISGRMVKSLLKIILSRPSCVKEQ